MKISKQKIKIAFLLPVLLLLNANIAKSQWAIMLNDADSLVLLGADYVYNLEFEKASDQFKLVQQKYPLHPAGYFLDSMIEWWKIALNQDDKSSDNLFFNKIDKVIQVCNNILDTNAYDINALFFKGGAIGYRARLRTMRDDWFQAIQDAKEALDILRRCQQLAPFNHDIMLGTGLYNYFSVKFPEEYPIIKPLMLFLPNGDKRLGLFQLRAAARHARYAAVEAKVALLQIYYSFENDNYEALQIAQELSKKYPNNTYFLRYLGRIQVRLGMILDYENTWKTVMNKVSENRARYSNSVAREATYYIGLALLYRKEYNNSLKYFQKSLEGTKIIDKKPTGFLSYTLIKIGNNYDAMGKRDEAIKYYKSAFDLPDFNDSKKIAKRFLENPYKP